MTFDYEFNKRTLTPPESKRRVVPPKFPKLVTTARAAVLAVLLSPSEFQGTEGVFAAGTIGLHAVIRVLARKYRWPVIRRDFTTGAGWCTTWNLSPEVIDAALDAGGRDWLDRVSAHRRQRATGNLSTLGSRAP